MADRVKIAAAILSLLRGEISAACVAERFGVTEAQVLEWKDTFLVAGILGLTDALKCGQEPCPTPGDDCRHDPTTFSPWDPTTLSPGDPTTTPFPTTGAVRRSGPYSKVRQAPRRKRRSKS